MDYQRVYDTWKDLQIDRARGTFVVNQVLFRCTGITLNRKCPALPIKGGSRHCEKSSGQKQKLDARKKSSQFYRSDNFVLSPVMLL